MGLSSPSSPDDSPGGPGVAGSGSELWPRNALRFLSDGVTPAWPQVVLAFMCKHHLSLTIKTWEEEKVDIPIDNAGTVPARVTVSCVLPRPIGKPTRQEQESVTRHGWVAG